MATPASIGGASCKICAKPETTLPIMVFGTGTPSHERFAELYETYARPLRRLVAAYARSSDDGDDLFQDIWMGIWRALPTFRGECSDRTFVYRIAHNRGISFLARRRPIFTNTADVELADPRPHPADALDARERGTRLLSAVRRLSEPYREVILLHLEGLSNPEIAAVLGVSYAALGVRLLRARRALRELLNSMGGL